MKIYISATSEQEQRLACARLIDYALAQNGLVAPEQRIVTRKNESSKPYLKNGGAYFNASHSHGHIAVAVSLKADVGLDIELDRPLKSFAVAKKIFSANEFLAFQALPHAAKSSALLKRWTLLESFFKLTGGGISGIFSYTEAPICELEPNVFCREGFVFDSHRVFMRYAFVNGLHICASVADEAVVKIEACGI